MAKRSDLDLAHRDQLHDLACPVCGARVRWIGMPEYTNHLRSCEAIEHARMVKAIDDIVPTVEQKPKGWRWAEG